MKLLKLKTKKGTSVCINIYDLLVISTVAVTVLLAVSVWLWYGYKDAQIENQIIYLR